jgi:hypothetical protein
MAPLRCGFRHGRATLARPPGAPPPKKGVPKQDCVEKQNREKGANAGLTEKKRGAHAAIKFKKNK